MKQFTWSYRLLPTCHCDKRHIRSRSRPSTHQHLLYGLQETHLNITLATKQWTLCSGCRVILITALTMVNKGKTRNEYMGWGWGAEMNLLILSYKVPLLVIGILKMCLSSPFHTSPCHTSPCHTYISGISLT